MDYLRVINRIQSNNRILAEFNKIKEIVMESESNLTITNDFKQVLVKKLTYATFCSVLSYVVVILLYVSITNFNLDIYVWSKNTFNTWTSFNTWLYLIPFSIIIFTQILICAKDYVLKSTYKVTRFSKFVSFFSVRTFVLGCLHVVIGGLVVWLYLSLSPIGIGSTENECDQKDICIPEGIFFLIVNGMWTGLYFFVYVHTRDRTIIFPVIHQCKLQHFKSKFIPLLQATRRVAVYPVLSYVSMYYLYKNYLFNAFEYVLNIKVETEEFSYWLYFYASVFTSLYILNMNLMRFFFELFLTEPVNNTVELSYANEQILSEALLLDDIPILQHLACLDLYLLSIWSPNRRQSLYALSQPGGHPHIWNSLVQAALKLIVEFTESLDKSTDAILVKEEKEAPKIQTQMNSSTIIEHNQQRRPTMRNMSLMYVDNNVDIVNISHQVRHDPEEVYNTISDVATRILTAALMVINNIPIIRYLFGRLPEAYIRQCLNNGQLIVWITQAIANIVVASFDEDPYGIVQKDLPTLITNLVRLKNTLERLNKVSVCMKKGQNFDEFSYKMSNSVNSAVKRSLCNISKTYGQYLNDIPLDKEVALQLKAFL